MPAKITLRIIGGKLKGGKFKIEERMVCIIGRDDFCTIKIPKEMDQTVSRHHCMLEINPPEITICDLGSINGTTVNGKRIGIRDEDEKYDPSTIPTPCSKFEYLKDGDEFSIGNTVFKIGIYIPAICAKCYCEIPDDKKSACERQKGIYICPVCYQQGQNMTAKFTKEVVCLQCGKLVSDEVSQTRRGYDYICKACRKRDTQNVKQVIRKKSMTDTDSYIYGIKGYKIIRELGRGGMGAVYLALDEARGQYVALKVMLPDVAVDPVAKKDFLNETQNAQVLENPNIVDIIDSGYSGGTFYFTMEYCDGGTVETLMKNSGGTLPVGRACEIISQTLNGLEYAHNLVIRHIHPRTKEQFITKGMLHHDIKPENIFMFGKGDDAVAKIGDFGLAHAFNMAGFSGMHQPGKIAGTLAFIPRHQLVNTQYSKPDLDVYASAASLYYMLTRRVPRNFEASISPIKTILQTDAIPIQARNPMIPKGLAEVIDLALNDTERKLPFESAAQLRDAILDVT